MKNILKMKHCQKRTNKIVWRHDIARSKQRWSTKRRSRRLRRCFDSSRISLVFSVFGTLLGRSFQRIRRVKSKKTKTPFPFFCFLSPLSSFAYVLFLSFFISFFLSFSLSLSLSLFLSFTIYFLYLSFFLSLSLAGRKKSPKSPKLSKIPKNTKITKNPQKPYKNRVPKITFAKITKHYENRGEKKSLEPNTPGENTLKPPATSWKHPENALKFMTFSTFSLCPLWSCPLHPSNLP